MHKRQFLQASLALLSIPVWAQGTGLAQIIGVRLWPAKEYTRITLEYDGKIDSNVFTVVDGSPRLVIDITGLQLNDTLREMGRKITADDPFVAGLRVGQYSPTVLRLVFDLKQTVVPQVVRSPAIAGFKNRLMVDVYPQSFDPIAAWLGRQATPAASPTHTPSLDLKTTPELGTPPRRPEPVSPVQSSPKPPIAAPNPAPSIVVKHKKIIVLDPGHGGEDPGAIGPQGTREKDVVLAIAQKMAQMSAGSRDWQVFLTRDADYFVPLAQRVKKARAAKAHRFASIHADAFTTPRARGASVFALSPKGASSSAARWLANKENEADLVGGLDLGAQDALSASVLLDMSTSAQIKDSLKLGGQVLKQLDRLGDLHKPRVEQAGFAVLKAPDVPSVLIETAFISNPDEERKLASRGYQEKLAAALWRSLSSNA